MYNLAVMGCSDAREKTQQAFGDKYDLTDDFSQANVIVLYDSCISEAILMSKLLFAVCDMTDDGLPDAYIRACSEMGIPVFRRSPDKVRDFIENGNLIDKVRDFIENGNLTSSANYPDVFLGPFGSDTSRVVVMMKGIDDPILLSAMIFSGMDVRAISGGLTLLPPENGTAADAETPSEGENAADASLYGASLIALREPVTRIPHIDGVIKVRVLQDI